MSSRSLSPIQFGHTLPMFMSGQEIKDHVEAGDFNPENAKQGWAEKLEESQTDEGYGESHMAFVKRQGGIEEPVSVMHPTNPERKPYLGDGHHRTAIAAHLGLILPVRHHG